MPENLSKKTKDVWDKKINGILICYEEYIRTVCGNKISSNPEVNWNAHMSKWENFKNMMKEYTVFTIKNEMNKRTTDSAIVMKVLNRMYQKIEHTTLRDPHPGLIIALHDFKEPYPLVNETDLLSLATMDLLIQFAYPSLSGYGKFTISFTMRRSYGEEITFTLGPAIPLTNEDGKHILPKSEVYNHIYNCIKKYIEIYEGDSIIRLMIRVYLEGVGHLYLQRREIARYHQLLKED